MLKLPTIQQFEAQKDTVFHATWDSAEPIDLKLLSTKLLFNADHNIQFSIEFLGDPSRYMGQGTPLLRHPDMEEMEIFMTPIRKTNDGFVYEAVFNYLMNPVSESNNDSPAE